MSEQQNDAIVEIRNVSMRFNLSKEKVDNLKEYVVKFIKHQLLFDEFYALRNVSFSVKRGEPFAIIGENGCGKSTLLKVISGIFYPTEGSVSVGGSVAPLIELGAGFDMDLTARENIFLNGAVLGYDTAFMEEKFNEIMDFAELWDFIDVPVKNFSSGMVARLGFSIATVVVPDILIVDEILSVGDFMFQQKCERKMQEMIEQGATLIFVSHSSEQVKKLCKKAVWLKHGVVQMIGDAAEVSDAYIHDMETGGHGLVTQREAEQSAKEQELPQTEPTEDIQKSHRTFEFLTLIRTFAIALIVWDHLGPFRNPEWLPGQMIEKAINRPLGIIQSFGALGVILFFLSSGFLLAHGGGKGNRRTYAAKRLFKIYPPLIVSFASFYVVQRLVTLVTGSPNYWSEFAPKQWVLGATLLNYFYGLPDVINGTTWYLFPTLIFYFLGFLLYSWIAKRPRVCIAAMQIFLAACYAASVMLKLPTAFVELTKMSWYLVFPIFGMLLYYLWNDQMGFPSFLFFGGTNYILMIRGITMFNPAYYETLPYAVSFAYAFLLFSIALLLNDKIKRLPGVGYLAKISYSVYVTHMPYGSLLLTLLTPRIGFTGSFLLTLLLVVVIAAGHYRAVEKPIARLLKRYIA